MPKNDIQHQQGSGHFEFGHFRADGERVESYYADYVTLRDGLLLLWLNNEGRAAEDKLVAVYKLECGHSVRRLLTTQTAVTK